VQRLPPSSHQVRVEQQMRALEGREAELRTVEVRGCLLSVRGMQMFAVTAAICCFFFP
jgi:hypothetical protein